MPEAPPTTWQERVERRWRRAAPLPPAPDPALPLRARVAALAARGLDASRIAVVLGRNRETVNYWLLRLATPPPAARAPGGPRAAALAYGRALVAAKVASGEWAPPGGGRP